VAVERKGLQPGKIREIISRGAGIPRSALQCVFFPPVQGDPYGITRGESRGDGYSHHGRYALHTFGTAGFFLHGPGGEIPPFLPEQATGPLVNRLVRRYRGVVAQTVRRIASRFHG